MKSSGVNDILLKLTELHRMERDKVDGQASPVVDPEERKNVPPNLSTQFSSASDALRLPAGVLFKNLTRFGGYEGTKAEAEARGDLVVVAFDEQDVLEVAARIMKFGPRKIDGRPVVYQTQAQMVADGCSYKAIHKRNMDGGWLESDTPVHPLKEPVFKDVFQK